MNIEVISNNKTMFRSFVIWIWLALDMLVSPVLFRLWVRV